MKLSTSDLSELADLAILAASQAGQMIARSRPREIQYKDMQATARDKSLASQVMTEIDRHSEDIILGILTPTLERFELGLLTEEQDDDGGRLTNDYFWCIDPLDGTLPFIEGSHGYAVSIALVGSDGTPVIGVVFDPVEATVLHAISKVGAFRNHRPWPTGKRPWGDVLSVFADRSFMVSDDHDVVVDALG
ncbi:MAG TPA: inositol monophosphatase, partial [Acidimicrobiaceae bacterium]|nr:inositol monophosphatase [Acidimicrobiaceae bacterium]